MKDAVAVGDPVRILLIEDDPRAALLVGEMLRSVWPDRLIFTQAERMADAAQELTDRGATCVLLNPGFPDSDMPAVIELVRTAAPTAAIIVLSDGLDEDAAMVALRAGAQDHLVKQDVYPALLRRTISHAIERKRCEVELTELALQDPLTGLPNRALFLDRLGVALDRSQRTGAPLAVLFLDVDNFKQVNDSLGHSAGDRVLAALAHRLRGMLRPMDTIARFGGDEFTMLFEDLASEREVVLIAERISRTTAEPIQLAEGETAVSVSIGIATVVDPTTPPGSVLREADAAMYRAKERGRSRYELFDEMSRSRTMERLELEAALSYAVERSELRVHYQPRISLRGELGVVGFEALVRWEHPERGLIAPGEFIPLAEETGTVLRIGEFVLGEALRHVVEWQRLAPDITMSINLSARQLEDTGLLTLLTGQIRASAVNPSTICLEVSETSITHDPEAATRAIEGLKALGVRIAIDDYGTGSASLSVLSRLPVDVLKIHESFIESLDGPEARREVTAAVVDLGHALGLKVAAEGVETDTQLAQLQAMGCDDAQGYLLGRPVPGEDVEALLVTS